MKEINGTYDRRGQQIVALMMLLVCVPVLKIGPMSASFFVGIILIVYIVTSKSKYFGVRKDLRVLLWFTFFSIVSILISPVSLDFTGLFTIVQIVYWFILAMVFYNICSIIEQRSVRKTIIISILLIGAVFIFHRPEEGGFLSENEASYIVISAWPIGLIGLTKWKCIIYTIASFIILFVIGSRTGLIIFLLQVSIFLFVERVASKKIVATLFIIAGSIALISNEKFREVFADTIFPDNYEMGALIKNPELALQLDKSWVQRRIQQEKCKQVFKKHPLLGVGPLNVAKYNFNIDVSKINDVDDRILNAEYDRSTARSTHNSYYQMIAENGILGLPLIVFFLLRTIYLLYKKRFESKTIIWVLGACLGMELNLFMVSAFWGSFTWILIGVYAGYGKQFNSIKVRNQIVY